MDVRQRAEPVPLNLEKPLWMGKGARSLLYWQFTSAPKRGTFLFQHRRMQQMVFRLSFDGNKGVS